MVKKLTADYVRKNFPQCVAVADFYRAVFGDGVKLVYAIENGKKLGKQSTGGCVQSLADIDLTPMLTNEDFRKSKGKR